MWNVKVFCCIWQRWCEVSTAKQCTHKIKSTTCTVRYTNSLKKKVDEANFHLWRDSKAEVWKLTIAKKAGDRLARVLNLYSQLSPCGHPTITDTPIKRTAAKSPAKTCYRRLTEINSRILWTLANEDTNSRTLQCPLRRELNVIRRPRV